MAKGAHAVRGIGMLRKVDSATSGRIGTRSVVANRAVLCRVGIVAKELRAAVGHRQ